MGAFEFRLYEKYYIRILSTPILTYLRTSLKTSLRKLPNLKAIQKKIIIFPAFQGTSLVKKTRSF